MSCSTTKSEFQVKKEVTSSRWWKRQIWALYALLKIEIKVKRSRWLKRHFGALYHSENSKTSQKFKVMKSNFWVIYVLALPHCLFVVQENSKKSSRWWKSIFEALYVLALPYCLFVLQKNSKKSQKFKVMKKHFGALYVLAVPYCLLPD